MVPGQKGQCGPLPVCLGWKCTFPTSLPPPSLLSEGSLSTTLTVKVLEGMCVKCHDFASATLAGPHRSTYVSLASSPFGSWRVRLESLLARGRAGSLRPNPLRLPPAWPEAPVPEGGAHADFVGTQRVGPLLSNHVASPVRQTVGRPPGAEAARRRVSGQSRQACFPAATRTDTEVPTGCGAREEERSASAVSVIPAVSSCRSSAGPAA